MGNDKIQNSQQFTGFAAAQVPAAWLLKTWQNLFASGPANFLKCVAVNQVMNWTTGCRPSAK